MCPLVIPTGATPTLSDFIARIRLDLFDAGQRAGDQLRWTDTDIARGSRSRQRQVLDRGRLLQAGRDPNVSGLQAVHFAPGRLVDRRRRVPPTASGPNGSSQSRN